MMLFATKRVGWKENLPSSQFARGEGGSGLPGTEAHNTQARDCQLHPTHVSGQPFLPSGQ